MHINLYILLKILAKGFTRDFEDNSNSYILLGDTALKWLREPGSGVDRGVWCDWRALAWLRDWGICGMIGGRMASQDLRCDWGTGGFLV